MIRLFLTFLAVLCAMSAPAFADGLTVGTAFSVFAPYLMTALSAVIMGGITWAANSLHKYTGATIDQANRDALHSALVTGIYAFLHRTQTKLDGMPITTKNALTDSVISWVITTGAPQAVNYFGLDEKSLSALIDSKINQLINPPAATPSA